VRLQRFDEPSARLDADALNRGWHDLAGSDAMAASQALTYLGERLRPARPVPVERIPILIADLDAEDYDVRHSANCELARLGDVVGRELRHALKKPMSLEMQRRLEQLLAALHNGEVCVPAGDYLRTLRAIRLLENIASPAARRILTDLARGDPHAVESRDAQAALDRLKR
jgi:hypothetical protein